jgi:hypothetical protein
MLWALLTEVAQQLDHSGKKYEPTQWKAIFLHAFGREVSFLPSLDQKTFLPIELSSSDLSKDEMTDFIEFIMKEAGERGVVFKDHRNHEQSESGPSAPEEPVSAEDGAPTVSAASDDAAPNPSSDAPHYEWLLNITKMLWGATNPGGELSVLVNQKKAALASYPTPADLPNLVRGKAEAVYGYAKQIINRELDKQDGLALIAGVVGVDQDDIGRVA